MGNQQSADPDTKAMEKLKSLVSTHAVVVLSKTYCPYCSQAKRLFKSLKVADMAILELDTESDGSALQSAGTQLNGIGHRTVPMIWIGGEFIGGASDLEALGKGKLHSKLEAAKAL